MNSAYQTGMNRKRCGKLGLATYRCARGTKRPNPTPTVNEGDVGKHYYYNERFNQSPMVQLETETIANKLGNMAQLFDELEHAPGFRTIRDSCDMTIITCGLPSATIVPNFNANTSRTKQNKEPFLSFACTPHIDACDQLCPKCMKHFIEKCEDNVYMKKFIFN